MQTTVVKFQSHVDHTACHLRYCEAARHTCRRTAV